jgi:hypothetical protein
LNEQNTTGVSATNETLIGLVGFESSSTDVVMTPSVIVAVSGFLTVLPVPAQEANKTSPAIMMEINSLLIFFSRHYSLRNQTN